MHTDFFPEFQHNISFAAVVGIPVLESEGEFVFTVHVHTY